MTCVCASLKTSRKIISGLPQSSFVRGMVAYLSAAIHLCESANFHPVDSDGRVIHVIYKRPRAVTYPPLAQANEDVPGFRSARKAL